MSKVIKFTNTIGTEDIFPPEPAAKILPDWYKNLDSYVGGEKVVKNGQTTATIKRCMPVFDAMSSGYIIRSQADVWVSHQPNEDGIMVPFYEWPNLGMIEFHSVIQAPTHPLRKGMPEVSAYPKWINPWAISTDPGYSCLFIQPPHRESVFTIFTGIVDTDNYVSCVNFPFVLNDWSFEGLIPAGTPVVQVIPFKRDSFQMEIGKEEDKIKEKRLAIKVRTRFFDSYKSGFREEKSYR